MPDNSKHSGFAFPDDYATKESRKHAKDALLKFFHSRVKEMKEIMKLQNQQALKNKRYEFLSMFGKIDNLISEFEQIGNQLNTDFPKTPENEYCSEEIEQCVRIDKALKAILESIYANLQKLTSVPEVNEVSNLLKSIREDIEKSKEIVQQRLENFDKIKETHKQCEKSIHKLNDELQRRALNKEEYSKILKFIDRFPDPVYPVIQVMEILNERINTMLRTAQSKTSYDASMHRFFNLCEKMLEMLDSKQDQAKFSDAQKEIVEKFLQSREKVSEGQGIMNTLLDVEKQARVRAQTTPAKKKKSPLVFIVALIFLIIIIAIIITQIKG